ncbi:hypothetical protein E2C01_031036 [Portunus trituberculatus]|uniref:Uncharacterized protein n=1 Tax=Portunus trituberculatus TaxID=210409 RepID=A0A5B7ES03_PORTR|nr:hypothetical protein [Portunus trituberculatus]
MASSFAQTRTKIVQAVTVLKLATRTVLVKSVNIKTESYQAAHLVSLHYGHKRFKNSASLTSRLPPAATSSLALGIATAARSSP